VAGQIYRKLRSKYALRKTAGVVRIRFVGSKTTFPYVELATKHCHLLGPLKTFKANSVLGQLCPDSSSGRRQRGMYTQMGCINSWGKAYSYSTERGCYRTLARQNALTLCFSSRATRNQSTRRIPQDNDKRD
jgi:hypothetical protein